MNASLQQANNQFINYSRCLYHSAFVGILANIAKGILELKLKRISKAVGESNTKRD